MSAPLGPLIRFGAFELDLRSGELRKAGVRINFPGSLFKSSRRYSIVLATS